MDVIVVASLSRLFVFSIWRPVALNTLYCLVHAIDGLGGGYRRNTHVCIYLLWTTTRYQISACRKGLSIESGCKGYPIRSILDGREVNSRAIRALLSRSEQRRLHIEYSRWYS